MTAAALLSRVAARGGRLRNFAGKLKLEWPGEPPADVVAELRSQRDALLAFLAPLPPDRAAVLDTAEPFCGPLLDVALMPATVCLTCGSAHFWAASWPDHGGRWLCTECDPIGDREAWAAAGVTEARP